MLFKILILLMETLFPKFSTDCAAANEAAKRDSSLSKLNFINNASIESIESPAPILSTDFFAKASQK